jgi:hypothetical protein
MSDGQMGFTQEYLEQAISILGSKWYYGIK